MFALEEASLRREDEQSSYASAISATRKRGGKEESYSPAFAPLVLRATLPTLSDDSASLSPSPPGERLWQAVKDVLVPRRWDPRHIASGEPDPLSVRGGRTDFVVCRQGFSPTPPRFSAVASGVNPAEPLPAAPSTTASASLGGQNPNVLSHDYLAKLNRTWSRALSGEGGDSEPGPAGDGEAPNHGAKSGENGASQVVAQIVAQSVVQTPMDAATVSHGLADAVAEAIRVLSAVHPPEQACFGREGLRLPRKQVALSNASHPKPRAAKFATPTVVRRRGAPSRTSTNVSFPQADQNGAAPEPRPPPVDLFGLRDTLSSLVAQLDLCSTACQKLSAARRGMAGAVASAECEGMAEPETTAGTPEIPEPPRLSEELLKELDSLCDKIESCTRSWAELVDLSEAASLGSLGGKAGTIDSSIDSLPLLSPLALPVGLSRELEQGRV